MGILRDPNYVREFTYRTKHNYYKNKTMFGDDNDKAEYERLLKALEKEMVDQKYVIEEYYEVTDLINSLVGLLVFPEQNLYTKMSNKENDLEQLFPTLYKYTQNENYINTYSKRPRNTPQNIIRHIKNSLSHDRIMMYPRNDRDENQISKIIIQDCDIRGKYDDPGNDIIRDGLKKHFGDVRELNYDIYNEIKLFSIEIPVKSLEKVVMEICDYALSISR